MSDINASEARRVALYKKMNQFRDIAKLIERRSQEEGLDLIYNKPINDVAMEELKNRGFDVIEIAGAETVSYRISW